MKVIFQIDCQHQNNLWTSQGSTLSSKTWLKWCIPSQNHVFLVTCQKLAEGSRSSQNSYPSHQRGLIMPKSSWESFFISYICRTHLESELQEVQKSSNSRTSDWSIRRPQRREMRPLRKVFARSNLAMPTGYGHTDSDKRQNQKTPWHRFEIEVLSQTGFKPVSH